MRDTAVFHAHDCSINPALDQAITAFMVEAAGICAANHWRVNVVDRFGEQVDYVVDFSTGGAITEEEMNAVPSEDRRILIYYEVIADGRDGLPELKRRVAEFTFIAKEDDGTRNRAVENSIYKTFIALYHKALENYNNTSGKRFITTY